MKTVLAILLLTLMVCPAIFAGGCQECACKHPAAVAPTYRSDQNPNDNANQNNQNNSGQWYGSEAGSAWDD